eukprot:COSAG01_NODE_34039_length_554_cov_2.413187_1_plen_144_part_00
MHHRCTMRPHGCRISWHAHVYLSLCAGHSAPTWKDHGCRISWHAHVHLSLCAGHSAPAWKACYRPSLQKGQRGAAAVGAPGWSRRPVRPWGASAQQRARNCHSPGSSSLGGPGTAPGRAQNMNSFLVCFRLASKMEDKPISFY